MGTSVAFFGGGSLYLLEDGREADFEEIGRILMVEKIRTVHFVPSALEGFLRYVRKKNWRFPELEQVIMSGETLPAPLAKEASHLFENADIWNFYGPAECAIDVSSYKCNGQEDCIPIGKPVWETGLCVVNSRGEEVPDGIEGELIITGKLVGKGYLEGSADKEQQARFFRQDSERAYRTGDRAVWKKDGNLYYLGRKDREVKIRGMRMNLAQIESAMERIEGVTGSAVRKEGDKLIAYYTAEDEIAWEMMREELRKELLYYGLPDKTCYLKQFPLGRNGKKIFHKLQKGTGKKILR